MVLAGSGARRKALERLAAQLGQRGVQVRLAVGIERSMVGLLQASFRYRDDAVYLVCGGLEIPGPMLHRIVMAIRSNGVPAQRIWSGTLDWANEGTLLRQAEHRLAALGLEVGLEDTSGPVHVGPPQPQPQPASGAATPPPVPPQSRRATMVVATTPAPNPPPGSRTPSVNVPSVGDASDERPSVDPPSAGFLGSAAGKGVMAAAAILLLGGVTWGVARADGPDDASVETAPAVVAAQLAPEVEVEAEQAPEVEDEDPAPSVDEAPAEVELTPTAKAAIAEATAAAEPDAEPEPTEPEVELEPEPTPTPAPGTVEDRELIDLALEAQSIRALDILLVAPTATKPRRRHRITARMRFDAAETYCAELSIDGIGSWRLPEVGEAGWLSRANIIREGIFWTSTKADAYGNDHVIWNARSKRMGSTSSRWKGGRVACVRTRRLEE